MVEAKAVCFFCGVATDQYVIDVVNLKKVPVCEPCFWQKVYPSEDNLQRLEFWRIIFPLTEKVKT